MPRPLSDFTPTQDAYRVHGEFSGEDVDGLGLPRNLPVRPSRGNLALAGLSLVAAALIRRTVRRNAQRASLSPPA